MSLWRDLRYAARSLRRAPGFTIVAAAVLAVGIGANSAMFSLVDATLLRSLPFAQPDRLVMMWERSPRFAHNRVSPLNFLDWNEQQQAFATVAAISGGGRTLTGSGEAVRVPGQAVTWQFFDVLGIRPIAGVTFTADDTAARRSIVVISERLWKTRFGGDSSVVGRAIVLDDQPYTIVGVVPASFQILYPADMWTLFSSFGTGILASHSGVLLHNRGTGFRTIPGHPNAIAPHKRPFHTIIPGMLVKDGRAVMPFGVMGGQYQAVGHAHFIHRMLDRGMDPQEAAEQPRILPLRGVLQVERANPEPIIADLGSRGHVIEMQEVPLGGCQAIWIDHQRGVLIGGSEPRKDGLALGY